jgi:ABC-type branched-subunit amino acid transport system substrate-binding protein
MLILLFFTLFKLCLTEPFNATIGIMVPLSVTSFGGIVPLSFQQMATATILAVHHVNTRDGAIVGDDVAKSLPDGFRLIYKISDTRFSISGGVKAILDWRAQEGYAGFSSSCGSSLSTANVYGNKSNGIYATSSAKDKILSIVGPDLSEIAAATAVIAGLGGTPVTSYFAVSTTLSDKAKFPLFSRTVPVESFNMLGMANIMRAFGWKQCALLYSDSEYGNSFSAEFQQHAAKAGITIMIALKFKNADQASVMASVESAKSSGARVFVFLSQGTVNLEGALLGANSSGIGGQDGYAWIAGELGNSDPELILRDMRTPAALMRPLLLGWLVLSLDALHGERRAQFEAVYAQADPAAVYDPLISMARAGLRPPRSAYDAFAYDAVWATALGLAAWRSNRSASPLAGIRAARFPGASGPVAFDNVTGDRAPAGLLIQLVNLRPSRPFAGNWSAARLAQAAVGSWELSQGAPPAPRRAPRLRAISRLAKPKP